MAKRSMLICLLGAAIVIVAMIGHYVWTAKKEVAVRGVVTGITYAEGNPSAVIDGNIVYEGETINGVKVVKIYRDKVEFEKNSKRWIQQVRENPNPSRL